MEDLREQQVEAAKQVQLDALVDVYFSMGTLGLRWEEVSLGDRPAQRELIAARPARLTLPHLKCIVRAWRYWVSRRPDGADLYRSTGMQLGLFLRAEAKQGPTVAPSRLRSFRWMRVRIGFPFP